jgi:signal transduction histidine kinase
MGRRRQLSRGNNRLRLMLTLCLAVVLPALGLIYVNFNFLRSIKLGKKVETLIHSDFQYVLAVSEKRLNEKAYAQAEEVRGLFPNPDADSEPEKARRLDLILSRNPWLSHVFLFDSEKGFLFRSQPQRMGDGDFREEHNRLAEFFGTWFRVEGKMVQEDIRKKKRHIVWDCNQVERDGGYVYKVTAVFALPKDSRDRVVIGGVRFDPDYLKQNFFPEVLDEIISQKLNEDREGRLAMMVYPADYDGARDYKPFAASAGWSEGRPEVSHNLDDVFHGLALGIKFQGTTVEAMGRRWVLENFLLLGVLSVLMFGGLALAYRSVSKEVALARLKSDFVSNVSHELRTPLALIRLYAETLELGRIKTEGKKADYYRIIRKESERLTALINNILDFSRIEAGRKEYDFRETDIAELVRNTLDAYRYQIEQQGFAFEQSIDENIPVVRVDREAIARALVNLINNALKYSAQEKFLGVNLYRADGVLKLEVVDRGIGITRREQSKIFEKFYRTGDPLVHNTKGSGLGLSLVRHITHAHGGEVEVESTPGKGSKFTLSLPLATAA